MARPTPVFVGEAEVVFREEVSEGGQGCGSGRVSREEYRRSRSVRSGRQQPMYTFRAASDPRMDLGLKVARVKSHLQHVCPACFHYPYLAVCSIKCVLSLVRSLWLSFEVRKWLQHHNLEAYAVTELVMVRWTDFILDM